MTAESRLSVVSGGGGPMRRVRAAVALALLLPLSGVAAAGQRLAAPPVPQRKVAELAGLTTIDWAGARGISLRVKPGAVLASEDVDLNVSRGTYALVRLVPRRPLPDCPTHLGPHCNAWSFSWIKGVTSSGASTQPPARQHLAGVTIPASWDDPVMDAYLLTDGSASLTMRFNGLSGRTHARATGTISASVQRLRTACDPGPCGATSPAAQSLVYGRASRDVGAAGWADIVAWSWTPPERGTASNALRGTHSCFYPRGDYPTGSADPGAYELGCTPRDPHALSDTGGTNGAWQGELPGAYSVAVEWRYWSGAKGRQYIGFKAVAGGDLAAESEALGMWLTYGIK